jgi:hypothetical protein
MAEDLKETKWLTGVKQLLRLTKVRTTQLRDHVVTRLKRAFWGRAQIATSVILKNEPLVVRGVAKTIYEHQITSLAQLCLGSCYFFRLVTADEFLPNPRHRTRA